MKYDIASPGQKVRLYERLKDLEGLLKILIVLVIILSAIVIAGFLVIFGNQDQILTQQIDTLDQLNYIRQAMELQKGNPDAISEAVPADLVTYQLSPEERATLERIVMSESNLEPFEAKMAVAQTIYDRMNDFGDTLPEAIKPYSTNDNGDPTDSVKQAVSNVFDQGERVYAGGAYQFHDDTVEPYWTEGKIARGSIGRLSFYGGYAE